jgi:hypothetical protein
LDNLTKSIRTIPGGVDFEADRQVIFCWKKPGREVNLIGASLCNSSQISHAWCLVKYTSVLIKISKVI